MMRSADATTNTDGDATSDVPQGNPAVYRLLPSLSDYETLRLDGADQSRLMRWQRSGDDADRPTGLRAEWMDDSAPRSEFPSGSPGAPVLGRRLAEGCGEELLSAGRRWRRRRSGTTGCWRSRTSAVVPCRS